jgi:hypothetical protein
VLGLVWFSRIGEDVENWIECLLSILVDWCVETMSVLLSFQFREHRSKSSLHHDTIVAVPNTGAFLEHFVCSKFLYVAAVSKTNSSISEQLPITLR